MLIKPLCLLFEDGGLRNPTVERVTGDGRGYLLHFQRRDGRIVFVTTYRSSGEEYRVFKSLDGAAQIARKIGFEEVKVKLDGVEDMKQKTVGKSPAYAGL